MSPWDTSGEGCEGGHSIATVCRYLSTLNSLRRLLDVPGPTKAQIVRNTLKAQRKTLLAVAHNSLARLAELVAIDVADMESLEEGVATVALRPTKTNLEAERDYCFRGMPTVALVREWLTRSG